MTRRRLALVAGAAVLVLTATAACTTTTNGKDIGAALRGDGTGSSSGGGGQVFTDVSGLAAQITHGALSVKSAQGTLDVDSGPLTQTSTFREQMANGQVTTLDDQVDTTYQGKQTKVHVLYVTQTIYIDRGQNGKPWIIATPSSSDPLAAQLAQSFPQSLAQSSVKYYALMVSAGHDLEVVGTESVDGVPAVHYHFIVDPKALVAKLPPEQAQQMQQAVDAGVDSIPVDEWIDAKGRPVRVTDSVTAQGQTAKIDLRLNHYDEPLTIAAPPADQIEQ